MSRVHLMRLMSVVTVVVLFALAGLPAASAPAPAAGPAAPAGQDAPGSFLTGPNQGDPLDIALAYIRQTHANRGLGEADLADLVVTDRYTTKHNGVTHIYLRQRYAGIEVFSANANINIAADGSVISMGEMLVPSLGKAVNTITPKVSAVDAVQAAASSLGLALSEPLEVLESAGKNT